MYDYENVIFSSNKKKILYPLDRTQWIRAMTNLIQNGLQSISTKKKSKIEVYIKEKSNKVVISVKDNGMGVDPNLKEKIFEPKFTTKTKGMGLGLGIVKNIVDSHNGKISYKTESKTGTTFKIELNLN